jgi:hypothetical protein
VVGDPADGYVGPNDQDVVDKKYLLTSGTVDGREFSFVGYSQRTPEACLELAGPATSDHLQSPGPHPPGALATTGGVGGYCVAEQIPATLLAMGWPDFPNQADIFMRAVGTYTGFVTERVSSLQVHLSDGTVVDIPVLHFPNQWNYGAFIFFPPRIAISGDLEAFGADGSLLATAPLCGPNDGVHACDVSPTLQLVPVDNASAST